MNYNKRYKDNDPKETVRIVQERLKKWGIDVEEEWFSGSPSLYTVRIELKDTTIGANGKGTSKEYALASAYGELCERLSMLLPFRLNGLRNFMTKDMICEFGMDEVVVKHLENNKWMKTVLNDSEIQYFIDNPNRISNSKGIVCIPYTSFESETLYIPLQLHEVVYGSNGMAAGNTFEEAMVQGLCEIIERYTGQILVTHKQCVPDITSYVCAQYDFLEDIIKNIVEEKEQRYDVLIKDLSMGKNLPVVAAILIDYQEKKYFVNLGCHPKLEIAVERAITELFQGRSLESFSGMTSITANQLSELTEENRYSILLDGSGIYNMYIFGNEKKEKIDNNIWKLESNENKVLVGELVALIKTLGYDVYYNETDFIGLNVVSIIVPGMSELTTKPSKYFESEKRDDGVKRIIQDIESAEQEKIKLLIGFLEKKNEKFSLMNLYKLPMQEECALDNCRKNLLLMMLYIYIQDYAKAYNSSIDWNRDLEESNQERSVIVYYKAISAVLAGKLRNMPDKDIVKCLSPFFQEELIRECMEDMKRENIFRYIPLIDCDDCDICAFQGECKYNKEKSIYKVLLEKKHAMTKTRGGEQHD